MGHVAGWEGESFDADGVGYGQAVGDVGGWGVLRVRTYILLLVRCVEHVTKEVMSLMVYMLRI